MDLLGNLNDKDLLHLQCHFGLDTLSRARLGANVTGVDFSETAIELAQKIADQMKNKFLTGYKEKCRIYENEDNEL